VRELKNVIERAVILSQGKVLRLDLSMPSFKPETSGSFVNKDKGDEDEILTEKQIKELQTANLIKALKQSNWRVSGSGGAAELLGVRPTTLADRIKSYKIKRPAS
jgi:transcriptional regulator with GAF, ATPase, and Fis domain